MQRLGLILIVLSFLPWVAIPFVLPFLPLSVAQKAASIPVLLVIAEIMFWLGVLLVGKQAAQRYRQYFTLGFVKKQVRKFRRKR
ncbi:transporter suffix domain-containing protein [Plectonema radiosum NIES-515]|uniref:Transporter suffix domain-containing protein n=1 Tax=Plectonema radiosum NIES-515 TaxID=2986073 RepID=A0ABT3B4D0_9CYAN|nr:transporter suffix domain-containing protein [Plectonema radiosum]MCV3216222.1 transporter suffix domain-containing protein [Plectonema radiosum NIES-515]